MVSVSLGESLQLEAEQYQYSAVLKSSTFLTGFRLDNQSIDAYNNFKLNGAYKQNYYKTYLNFQNSEI